MTGQFIEDEIDTALYDSARKFAASEYNFDDRRRLPPGQRRFSPSAWSTLAGMGWLSVATAEEDGGLGLRVSSIAVLAEASGAMFLSEPLAETAFYGAHLVSELGSPLQKASVCPKICDGSLRLAVALDPREQFQGDASFPIAADDGSLTGSLQFVPGADICDMMIVRAADSVGWPILHLVDLKAEGVEIFPYPLIDGRGAARVELAGAASERLGEGREKMEVAVDDALAIGALAIAADSLGVMRLALNLTVEYLKTRMQFGRPIGMNQVLQHRSVDMYMLVEEASAVLAAAVHSGPVRSARFRHHVHAAKAIVDAGARKVVHEAIQLHGGIGMADEHVVGQCLRRVIVNEQLFGRRSYHLERFASTLPRDFSDQAFPSQAAGPLQ